MNGNAASHILSQSSDALCYEKLRVLLRHKCDLENRNLEGLTALIIASRHNNLEAAKLLLESGANTRSVSPPHNITALHWAAFDGCSALIDLLLKHGGEIEARTEDGSTPLLIAVQQKKWPIVRQLIELKCEDSRAEQCASICCCRRISRDCEATSKYVSRLGS
jgi:ankyrin repeat protein